MFQTTNQLFRWGSHFLMFITVDIQRKEKHMQITSSTAQGGGGSFKNKKPIGEVGCCESGMAKRIH